MYEPYGTSGSVTVKLPKISAVTETSPLEEAVGETISCDSIHIAYKPFEIRTFRIV